MVDPILELDAGGGNGLNIGPNNVIYFPGYASGNHVRRAGPASVAAFEVTLSHAAESPITVDYTVADATAKAGNDYVPINGILLFEPRVTSRTIVVPTIDDPVVESDETFSVSLSNPVGATILDATGMSAVRAKMPTSITSRS